MGVQHARYALQVEIPDLYKNIRNIIMNCNKTIIGYTLTQTDNGIVVTPIISSKKTDSFSREIVFTRAQLLEKELTNAWRAAEWLTTLPPHIKKPTEELIIKKMNVNFKKISNMVLLEQSDEVSKSVASAFKKSHQNYDRITGTTYDSRVFTKET